MEAYDIYSDIAKRTNGDILIGVVGPVRTGKSTFIKRFADSVIVKNIADMPERARVIDELPQSGAGTTIMTTQPKFVPPEAVEITVGDKAKMRVRLIDCVGYMVNGAKGHMENGAPRMVKTPWFEESIPFEQAADVGTKKVIADHSTIGIVMTTDGSITDIGRNNYVAAEERAVNELKAAGKPFVVIVNSTHPSAPETQKLKHELAQKYGVTVLAINAEQMEENAIDELLTGILYEFPVKRINIELPKWADALSKQHWLIEELVKRTMDGASKVEKVGDYKKVFDSFDDYDAVARVSTSQMILGEGEIDLKVDLADGLFYKVVGDECGVEITDDYSLMSMLKELVDAKKSYDKVRAAMAEAEEFGYGVVCPKIEEMILEEPEVIRQGGRYGIKIRAVAPSVHMVKVDVMTEVSPIVGTEEQSEEMMKFLTDEMRDNPTKIWQTNIFGKTLNDMVSDGLLTKITSMPPEVKLKIKESLSKMINEGSGGVICILI